MLSLAGSRITHLVFLGAAFIPVGIWLIMSKGYRMARLTAFPRSLERRGQHRFSAHPVADFLDRAA